MRSMNEKLENILEYTAKIIDITDDMKEKAENRYESISEWLHRENSELYKYVGKNIDIYSQGSISIGTAIRPIVGDFYDVDAICCCHGIYKSQISQKNFKDIFVRELRSYTESYSMKEPIEENKKCITLKYDDEKFHIDIVPAIPYHDNNISTKTTSTRSNEIAITDKSDLEYKNISYNWTKNNPKDYTEWFRKKMEVKTAHERTALNNSIEPIPDYSRKTALQKCVQLIKRYRDVYFFNNQENSPSSIIITTMAGYYYNNEVTITDALNAIIGKMKAFCDNKETILYNPIMKDENFFKIENNFREQFYGWVERLNENFNELQDNSIDLRDKIRILEELFHEKTISKVRNKFFPYIGKIWRQETPKWIENIKYNMDVEAKIDDKYFGNWSYTKKDKSILFKLRFDKSVQEQYKIYYKVVNTGSDARKARQLRGNIEEMKEDEYETLEHQEKTLYRGMHSIEFYVIFNNKYIIAKDKFYVVVR
jgi:hypothetical protein